MKNSNLLKDVQRSQHAASPPRVGSSRPRPTIAPNRLFKAHLDSVLKGKSKVEKRSPSHDCSAINDFVVEEETPPKSQCDSPETDENPPVASPYAEGDEDRETAPGMTAAETNWDDDECSSAVVEENQTFKTPVGPLAPDQMEASESPEIAAGESVERGYHSLNDTPEETFQVKVSRTESSSKKRARKTSRSSSDKVSVSSKGCSSTPQKRNRSHGSRESRRKSSSSRESRRKSSSSRESRRKSSSSRENRRKSSFSREPSETPKSHNRHSKPNCKRQSSPDLRKKRSSSHVKESSDEESCTVKTNYEVKVYGPLKSMPYSLHGDSADSFKSPSNNVEISKDQGCFDSTHRGHAQKKSLKATPLQNTYSENVEISKVQGCSDSTPRGHVQKKSVKATPLQNTYSSETYSSVAVSSSSSEDETTNSSKVTPIVSGSYSSSSQSDTLNSKSGYAQYHSYAPPFSPNYVGVSLRPDVAYNMPCTPSWSNSGHLNFPSFIPPGLPLGLLSYPPPPPPPAHPALFSTPPPSYGVHNWSYNATPSPNQGSPNLFGSSSKPDRRFQLLQSLHDPPKPNFLGYQLIGDSMLLRFSQQILNESAINSDSLRFLGLCVSGQKIGELLKRLQNGFYQIAKKVIVMIGTNDMLQNTNINQMCHELAQVVAYLRKEAELVVLLTLPPVPRLENTSAHWIRLQNYNNFIKRMGGQDSGIYVLDVSTRYVVSQEELEEEELMAALNAGTLFCQGCLTCLEEKDDCSQDFSLDSDDENIENLVLTNAKSVSSPPVKFVDINSMFVEKRIYKSRLDCFEIRYSDNGRKDLIHLNNQGLKVVRDHLRKVLEY